MSREIVQKKFFFFRIYYIREKTSPSQMCESYNSRHNIDLRICSIIKKLAPKVDSKLHFHVHKSQHLPSLLPTQIRYSTV